MVVVQDPCRCTGLVGGEMGADGDGACGGRCIAAFLATRLFLHFIKARTIIITSRTVITVTMMKGRTLENEPEASCSPSLLGSA